MIRAKTASRNAEIVRLSFAGVGHSEIAARLGIGLATVKNALRKAGVIPRSPQRDLAGKRDQVDQILDAWVDGLSIYDLSLLSKRSERAVKQAVYRARMKGDPRATARRPAPVRRADPWAAIRALRDRAHVAAEYRVGGSPHEWIDEDSMAMARFVLAACEVLDAP